MFGCIIYGICYIFQLKQHVEKCAYSIWRMKPSVETLPKKSVHEGIILQAERGYKYMYWGNEVTYEKNWYFS